jgi:hypothetical protein
MRGRRIVRRRKIRWNNKTAPEALGPLRSFARRSSLIGLGRSGRADGALV